MSSQSAILIVAASAVVSASGAKLPIGAWALAVGLAVLAAVTVALGHGTAAQAVVVGAGASAAVCDARSRMIPLRLTLGAGIVALVCAGAVLWPLGLMKAALGVLVCGGFLAGAALLRPGSVGGADVLLAAAIGAGFGAERGMTAIAIALASAAIAGVLVPGLVNRSDRRLAAAPFLFLGAALGAL